ncbi:MAG: hypothetical protein R2713_00050 [Ilumatobacteraceae bacterium]
MPCLPVVVGLRCSTTRSPSCAPCSTTPRATRDSRRSTPAALRGFVGIELDQYRPVLELSPAPDA